MKEAYVSYETAKLLKEKGFDWPTIEYYSSSGSIYRFTEGIADICGIMSYQRPTQQMACSWLREEKGIVIDVVLCEVGIGVMGYTYCIWKVIDKGIFEPLCQGRLEDAMNYEKTLEAALEYVLTNLI